MTRDEFCKVHWEYYLVLERDFLATERYVSFELGDNYLYTSGNVQNPENSLSYSNEYIKQYQAICSEVDVIMQSICKEEGNSSAENMFQYTPIILHKWPNIINQKVEIKDFELQPFLNWQETPYQAPDWWRPYNKVKHKRIANYKKANLKNVLNALAGLYILNNYYVKEIGDRDNTFDVPNDISHLFEMLSYPTRERVIGRNSYDISSSDISRFFN